MLQVEGSRLLIVDDEPRNTRLLADIFRARGHDVLALNDSNQVIGAVARYEPSLIILDVMMPGRSGLDLARELKADENSKSIPIILLTALADRDSCVEGLETGAEDFVGKPFNQRELCARVNNLLKLKRLVDFQTHNLRLLKEYDPTSGLPRKDMFIQFSRSLFKQLPRNSLCIGICHVDLDQALLGFDRETRNKFEGQISRSVVERMASIFPPGILLGSFGFGKFGFILEATEEESVAHIRQLQNRLTQPVVIDQREVFLKLAIGYVAPSEQKGDWEVLLAQAEMALMAAQRDSGHFVKAFVPEMDIANQERWWISQALYPALRNDEFEVYYQPQINLSDEKLVGFEALMRWRHPEKGFISPATFIPLAEESGQIYDLSLWMIDTVCQQVKSWHEAGLNPRTAINVSAVQLHREAFTEDLMGRLGKYGLCPADFELELTEGSLMDPKSGSQLEQLQSQGFDIAIDDFGTGYSNLEYLKRFPFNRLKIDRTFIRHICDSNSDLAIVQAILTIAKQMGSKVIAEGVETTSQLQKIRELGCDEAQGFYYSRPVSQRRATDILAVGHC